jgi:hypothetical protein
MYDLNQIKERIEKLPKERHIEILKFLSTHNSVVMNENKSGVFINLTILEELPLKALIDYIKYIDEQEENLKTVEYQKKEFEDNYFNDLK